MRHYQKNLLGGIIKKSIYDTVPVKDSPRRTSPVGIPDDDRIACVSAKGAREKRVRILFDQEEAIDQEKLFLGELYIILL